MSYYKLVDKIPVKCSLEEFAMASRQDRVVAKTTLPNGKFVSTVFLTIDHQFGEGPPLLFETMLFPADGSLIEEEMDRYSTWEEATQGHRDMVEKHGGTVTSKDIFDDDLFEL